MADGRNSFWGKAKVAKGVVSEGGGKDIWAFEISNAVYEMGDTNHAKCRIGHRDENFL